MPIKKAAFKALKQSRKRAKRNAAVIKAIKGSVKSAHKAWEAKSQEQLAQKAKEAIKALDKAVQNKVLKKNAAARKKSRLMKKLNSLVKK